MSFAQGPAPLTFRQQTVRQYVFTSIGGQAARLHFSNQYGTAPLTITDVHVAAVKNEVGDILTETDRAVTFGGASTIVIPAGGTITSDAVTTVVPARGYLVISIYLPDTVSPETLTTHFISTQHTRWADGDLSSAEALPPETGGYVPTAYYFLTGVDVQNPTALGAVVQLGASITDSQTSSVDKNLRWGNDLFTRLQAAGLEIGVLDQGIPGSDMLHHDDKPIVYTPAAIDRFTRDVLSPAGVRWMIYSEYNDPTDFGALTSGLLQMMNMAHAQQIRFICSTTPPFLPPGFTGVSATATVRLRYNAFIRQPGNGCDAVIDQDLALHDPNDPGTYLKAYNSGDDLHPNDAGYQAIADAVPLEIFRQPTPLAPVNPSNQCGVLIAGKNLSIGSSVTSCDGRFLLDFTADGSLTLWQGNVVLWSAQTGGVQARMLQNGNFVVADGKGRPTWATNSDGHPNAVLVVQNDGNVVIYAGSTPVWNLGTCCH